MSNIDWLREQTARLFGLANHAREKGNQELADLLTAAACRCLDRLNKAGGKTPPRTPIASEPPQPVVLQQQQIQPKKDD